MTGIAGAADRSVTPRPSSEAASRRPPSRSSRRPGWPTWLIEARLTQQELAEMIGTTMETLAHTLGDFRRRGLLDTEHHRVLIRDAELLAEIAEGDES